MLTPSNVMYYKTDSYGIVTQLVLNAVTGDTFSYGVLTGGPSDDPKLSSTLNSYTYIIAGTASTFRPGSTRFNVSIGPAMFYL